MKMILYSDRDTAVALRQVAETAVVYDHPRLPQDADAIVYALPLDDDGWKVLENGREMLAQSVVVSQRPTLAECRAALRGGADALALDYIPAGEMATADIQRAFAGLRTVRYKGFTVDLETSTAHYNGELLELSPKQAEILAVFLKQPGKAITYQEIVPHVYPGVALDTDQARSKLRNHIWNVRGKTLKAVGRDVIVNRDRLGYVLVI
jgi:DNA-binding response OmpR family regulator